MLRFIKSLISVKADNLAQEAVKALVTLDPEAATEAELKNMEQNLDKLGVELAKARQSYAKEQKEADEIIALFNQRIAAAQKLEEQIAVETDAARRGSLEQSLDRLVTMLEEMKPDVQREQDEAVDAKAFLEEVEQAYRTAGERLKGARAALEKAAKDMKRAEMQQDQAKARADRASRLAGITKSVDSLSVALTAMNDKASDMKAKAESANMKAQLLTKSDAEKDDPNIAAALAEVSGKSLPSASASDRLKALGGAGSVTASDRLKSLTGK